MNSNLPKDLDRVSKIPQEMIRLTRFGRENTMIDYKNKIVEFEKKYNDHNKLMTTELSEENTKGLSILQKFNKQLELQQ